MLYASGCGAPSATVLKARNAFYANRYDLAVPLYRKESRLQNKNQVLTEMEFGSAALTGGNSYDAEKALLSASKGMSSDAGKASGVLSLVSDESLKLFKGEPFEKAMAFFYLGVIYYNRGDYENARAAFNSALLMDKQSQQGFQDDLRLVFFMLGKSYLKLNEPENARIAFQKANARHTKEKLPANSYFDLELAKKVNFTVIVELGLAPLKIRTGPGASLDDFQRRSYPEKQAQIYLNGVFLGNTANALDLFYEAEHRGSSGKDVVQGAKGVAREAAVATAVLSDKKEVQLGALLFALANQSQADIRQWDLLPGELQVYSGKVEPGLKTVRLEFRDAFGSNLNAYQQIWYYLPILAEREQVYLFRSGRYKGDGSYLLKEKIYE